MQKQDLPYFHLQAKTVLRVKILSHQNLYISDNSRGNNTSRDMLLHLSYLFYSFSLLLGLLGDERPVLGSQVFGLVFTPPFIIFPPLRCTQVWVPSLFVLADQVLPCLSTPSLVFGLFARSLSIPLFAAVSGI